MIKAVIFDLDGTISDTLSTIAHYGNVSLKHIGLEEIDEVHYKYFAGDGKKVLLHRMLQHLGKDTDETFKKLEKKYDFEYESDVIGKSKPFDGIEKLLSDLKKSGIKTAVLSNKPDNVTVLLCEKIFSGLLDICHGKMDNIPAKPDPMGVKIVLDELGVKNNEVIFCIGIFCTSKISVKPFSSIDFFERELIVIPNFLSLYRFILSS